MRLKTALQRDPQVSLPRAGQRRHLPSVPFLLFGWMPVALVLCGALNAFGGSTHAIGVVVQSPKGGNSTGALSLSGPPSSIEIERTAAVSVDLIATPVPTNKGGWHEQLGPYTFKGTDGTPTRVALAEDGSLLMSGTALGPGGKKRPSKDAEWFLWTPHGVEAEPIGAGGRAAPGRVRLRKSSKNAKGKFDQLIRGASEHPKRSCSNRETKYRARRQYSSIRSTRSRRRSTPDSL